MIRQATKYDKNGIIELMQCFRKESDIEGYRNLDNPEYWNRLLDTIFAGAGVVFYEEGKGLLMAMVIPSLWCNKTFFMQELAWYVKPEYRNTTVGYKLLKQYIEHGKKLKEDGRIVMFNIGKMVTSPDVDYGRFGFKKLEETWIQ